MDAAMSAQFCTIQLAPASSSSRAGHRRKKCNHLAPAAFPARTPAGASSTTTQSEGGKPEFRRRLQIRLGIRLADLDVARRNHRLGDGQARGAQTNLGQRARAGGRNGPAIRRQSCSAVAAHPAAGPRHRGPRFPARSTSRSSLQYRRSAKDHEWWCGSAARAPC